VTEWQSADDRNSRDKINRARQAAEDLFKPARHIAETDLPAAPPNDAVPAEVPSRRQPRIFTLPPRVYPAVEAESPAEPKPTRRRQVAKRSSRAVPASQIGRVRTLAHYGMTPAQVAELYGVTIDEIERIIGVAAEPGKSR
jgi:hypothetical protein